MNALLDALAGPLQGILGYLNFSEGRPDPRVQRQWNEAYALVAGQGEAKPWLTLAQALKARLDTLHNEQAAAFRDIDQAGSVLDLLFGQVVPAYRQHHADLLHHLPEADFYQPFFLARLAEAVLAQRGPWNETDRIVQGTLKQVNDFVGHRPIAVLESRPRGEPYPHEQLRPIPLYLKGAGVAFGRFETLVTRALEILRGTDKGLLAEANFDLDLLDELALDPRGYDFSHPVDKRPNYCFGEWDPHHIDNKGYFRRFVLRQVTLEGLLLRTEVGGQKSEVGGRRSEVGDQRSEVGGRRSEVGSQSQEIGGQPSDVRPPTSDLRPPTADLRPPTSDLRPLISDLRPLISDLRPLTPRPPTSDSDELFEAGAVLAGIMLMASGISGWGPAAHDSTVSLGTLMPKVARVRDGFYGRLLQAQTGDRGQRLSKEAKLTRQPFGGARQHINQFFARQRALQIQQRRLALLLADLGYPHAARRQVATSPSLPLVTSPLSSSAAPAVRIVTEIHVHLTTGRLLIEKGALHEAIQLLPQIEDLLHRGIACGALVDPWNILGFQGQFPRFTSLEDSVHDTRIEDLIRIVDRLLLFYSRLLSEEAAVSHDPKGSAGANLLESMRKFADWWDRFGTVTVSEVPHVQGGEIVESAEHVAKALANWRQRGEAADLAFWKQHLDGFRTPKAFALVIEALLGKEDFRAAMALLMTWLGQAEEVPLSEGEHSFHTLALRWLMGVYAWSGAHKDQEVAAGVVDVVARFFDHLEANAEDYWQVPHLNPLGLEDESSADLPTAELADEEDSLYGAAYEDVTYKDSTDDNVDSEVLDVMPQKDFDLAEEEPRLQKRLSFLATLAQLWNIASRIIRHARPEDRPRCQTYLRQWLGRARGNFRELLALLDVLHTHEIPQPSGSYESMIEYDKRRSIKENLLNLGLTTCLSQTLAVGVLRGVVDEDEDAADQETLAPSWENTVRTMEKALLRKNPERVRALVGRFLKEFRKEPLLYTPLQQGGHPRPILRAHLAQTILRGLCANLPRQGLLRETWLILRAAHSMEKHQTLSGPRVTEFDRLFQIGCQACVESILDSARGEGRGVRGEDMRDVGRGARGEEEKPSTHSSPLVPQPSPLPLVAVLERLLEPLQAVWLRHSKGLRLSMLEAVDSADDWDRLCKFMQRYGKDLFIARFLTVANLRGILHRGIGNYLDYLRESDSDMGQILLAELDDKVSRDDAVRFLHIVLHSIIENYDYYRDYNATTSQSDYGENLYQLMHFFRIKDRYERLAWQLKPVNLVHEVLARRHPEAAELWRAKAEEQTRPFADELLDDLARVENQFGMRLTTVRDRLQERFVLPLAVDGLCAMIAPAMDQAAAIEDDRIIPLEEALRSFTAHPSGVGLDVPPWLGRLEVEFHQLQASRTALVSLAETLFQVPKIAVPFEKLEEQFGSGEDAGDKED